MVMSDPILHMDMFPYSSKPRIAGDRTPNPVISHFNYGYSSNNHSMYQSPSSIYETIPFHSKSYGNQNVGVYYGQEMMYNSNHSSRSPSQYPLSSSPSYGNDSLDNKCRQLPCRTWISTGTCPYNEKCVFLHDPRIIGRSVPLKHRRKSHEDQCQDCFYWPTMPRHLVSSKLDNRQMPHISQPYIVPHPDDIVEESSEPTYWPVPTHHHGSHSIHPIPDMSLPPSAALTSASNHYDPSKDPRHVEAVYSIWNYFLDFCALNEKSVVKVPRELPVNDPFNPYNDHTGKRRLPVLMTLSQSESIETPQSDLDSWCFF